MFGLKTKIKQSIFNEFICLKKIILLCENETTISEKVNLKCALPLRHSNTDKMSPDLQRFTRVPMQFDHCSFQIKIHLLNGLLTAYGHIVQQRDSEISFNLQVPILWLMDFIKHRNRCGQNEMVAIWTSHTGRKAWTSNAVCELTWNYDITVTDMRMNQHNTGCNLHMP